jgi:hypothetical protein
MSRLTFKVTLPTSTKRGLQRVVHETEKTATGQRWDRRTVSTTGNRGPQGLERRKNHKTKRGPRDREGLKEERRIHWTARLGGKQRIERGAQDRERSTG